MQEQEYTQVPPKKRKITKIILVSLYVIVALVLVIAVGIAGTGLGVVSAYTKNEKPRTKADFEQQLSDWSQTSHAYFKDAVTGKPKLLGAMHTDQDRTLIKNVSDVSPYLINALLSTEDREFYTHHGVVLSSILRAAIQQVIGSKVTTGGSTLTQQLVKNEILGDRGKTFQRKTLEIINAIRLEHYYTKPEILVSYLNSVYFGKGANNKQLYGVKAAARGLFNKDVKDLNLPEAAYIAGMVQRPIDYNPFGKNAEKHIKLGKKRLKLVLHNMLVNKALTQAQYDTALKYDITKSFAKPSEFHNAYTTYPFVVQAIENEAIKDLQEVDQKYHPDLAQDRSYNYYSNLIRGGGLKIYSTIDQTLYDKMNNSVQNLHFPERRIGGQMVREQIGAVMIDNKTGGVISFFAGTNFNENEQDHAFVAQNQPGSSIKPLLVYGPSLNEGVISPDSIIIDEPIKKEYSSSYYKNDGGNYHGAVTATKALEFSYNIPAIKVFRADEDKIGRQKVFDYLREMDIPPNKNDGEALALGGATYGFTVEQMTGGYAMIANGGVFNKPHLIDKITDSQGHVLYDYTKENKPKRIFSPQATYALTGMMKQVVKGGTAASTIGQISGYNIAGKTGTTSSEYDLWFLGFTPEVTMGVWSGYDYNHAGDHLLAKTAWVKLFEAAAGAEPSLIPRGSNFADPGGSVENRCFECNQVPPPSSNPSGQSSSSNGQGGGGGNNGGGFTPNNNNQAPPSSNSSTSNSNSSPNTGGNNSTGTNTSSNNGGSNSPNSNSGVFPSALDTRRSQSKI